MAAWKWGARLFVLGVVGAVPAGASDWPTPDARPVRTGNPAVSRLLADGAARSPTFAELLGRLGRTQWLVFVERGRCPERVAVGCLLHTVGRYDGQPFVRILVDDWRLGHPDLEISAIAHELHHTLEVAEAPEVIDTATLIGFFRRIGYTNGKSRRVIAYETEPARQVGCQVLEELQRVKRVADGPRE